MLMTAATLVFAFVLFSQFQDDDDGGGPDKGLMTPVLERG
tara:strand:- start:622 stop:741 length:120 start_codon:yes stop_codon:yes gene_type:complete